MTASALFNFFARAYGLFLAVTSSVDLVKTLWETASHIPLAIVAALVLRLGLGVVLLLAGGAMTERLFGDGRGSVK